MTLAPPQLVAAPDEELLQAYRAARPFVHSLIGGFGVLEADLREAGIRHGGGWWLAVWNSLEIDGNGQGVQWKMYPATLG